MVYRVAEVTADVRVAMDMNRTDMPLMASGDADTLSLDEVIGARLCEAARAVQTEAPLRLLEHGHDFVQDRERDFYMDADGCGRIVLPSDFMRLLAFCMSDWRRPVCEAIDQSHPAYAAQSSRWRGVRGCPERPVVAIVPRSEGLVLEFWSCRDPRAHVTQAAYVPLPEVDADGGVDISRGCYEAVVHRCAALALATLGDARAQTEMEISKSLLI